MEDIADLDVVPTEDLTRFGHLDAWRKQRAIAVYAEDLPRR